MPIGINTFSSTDFIFQMQLQNVIFHLWVCIIEILSILSNKAYQPTTVCSHNGHYCWKNPVQNPWKKSQGHSNSCQNLRHSSHCELQHEFLLKTMGCSSHMDSKLSVNKAVGLSRKQWGKFVNILTPVFWHSGQMYQKTT